MIDLLAFYKKHASKLRFKGTQPGQSESSKINELALAGDKYLGYRVVCELIKSGLSNGEISTLTAMILSNSNMSRVAEESGITIGTSTHANGTLLEAMIGLWVISGQIPANETSSFYSENSDLFEELIRYFVSMCLARHKSSSMEELFDPDLLL